MSAVDLLRLGGRPRTPMVHQTETAECGLACLAMVAGHHGFSTDMPALRRRFSLSLKGATLKALLQIAEQIGFNARPLRGEIDDLEQVALPLILFWDLNHFVVLTKISRGLGGRRFHIHDPSRGPKILHEGEFSRHFTGVFIELTPSQSFQKRQEKSFMNIGQLWTRMTGLWSTLRNVLLLSIVLQLIALASPFYLQLAVDTVFPSFDQDLLFMLAVGFGGLAVVNMLTGWLRSLILVSLSNSLTYQIVVNLCRHLLKLPLPWFEKRHVGDIISRFNSTTPISNILSQGLVTAILDGIMAFVTLGLMMVYSPMLGGLALIAWMLFAALKVSFIHALRTRNVSAITANAKEASAFIETIRGMSAIKAFGKEETRNHKWQQLKADAVNAQICLSRFSATFDSGGQMILAAERILFVYLAIRLAMSGDFTVGMIFAFQAYKQQFLDASTRLVEQAIQYKIIDVHLARISDIALAKPEQTQESEIANAHRVRGAMELSNVMFRYGAGEPEILRGVSFKVEPGEMIALVGPSGGGKTTLLKVMMGLFEPTFGQVLVDNRPLTSLGTSCWRHQIGSVMQDDTLFAGSLAENIAFFDPEIDLARVMAVTRLTGLHDEIEAMPMRYDTLVGDMGSALSGGQRQRVLLARALYPDPAILFIDEGTAHLDPASEAVVMKAIRELPITRIISAHRPMPIEAADKVYFVKGGSVAPLPPRPPAAAAPEQRPAPALEQ